MEGYPARSIEAMARLIMNDALYRSFLDDYCILFVNRFAAVSHEHQLGFYKRPNTQAGSNFHSISRYGCTCDKPIRDMALSEGQLSAGLRVMHKVSSVTASCLLSITNRLVVTNKVVFNSVNCCGNSIHFVSYFFDRPT